MRRTPPAAGIGLALLLAAAAAAGQAVETSVVDATVLRPDGTLLEGAVVSFRHGRITAVGEDLEPAPGAPVYDAAGRHLYPGLIDMGNDMGLSEIRSVRGSVDSRELGVVNPHLRTLSAINPSSDHIPVARANGVLYSLVGPSGGLIPGQATLITHFGRRAEAMAVEARAGVIVRFPRMSRRRGEALSVEAAKESAEKACAKLSRYLALARRYVEIKELAAAKPQTPFRPDLDLEAMIPVLEGEVPLVVEASRAPAMIAAVRWAKREGLRVILRGCREGWKIADFLAAEEVPCIIDSVFRVPSSDDPYDAHYANPGVLARAGVPIAFATSRSTNARNLPYSAAMAVSFGLDRAAALRALTSGAAAIAGAGDRIGSLEPGRAATFFLADGDILDIRTRVQEVWVEGRPVGVESRHTRLRDRFAPEGER